MGDAMATPEDIVTFWLDEVGPKGWYDASDELDQRIRNRFEATWHEAREGACGLWLTSPRTALAYLILIDQFPRNMFRSDARAFATDAPARAASKSIIDRGWDMEIDEPERQFVYLPLMHSENLIDQDRAVRLFQSRMPESGESNLRHARAHRRVIRKFGRFPYRNAALDRPTTDGEAAWLEEGGYAAALRAVDAQNAA